MRDAILKEAGRRREGEHPGLLLNRFLAGDAEGEKGDLIEAAVEASRNASLLALYGAAFRRWAEGTDEKNTVATPPHARLIVGLGQKGVLEAGLRLHHTYGTPLVPGSALKGLAAHYAHEVWGEQDARYRRGDEFHRTLFGTTDENGCVRFEDAWAEPGKFTLHRDVMTPHHQTWQTDSSQAPTDFDDPVPVPFLSVSGAFRLGLSWQGPAHAEDAKWVARAMELLKQALAEWGVGGKTSSGYGRLVLPDQAAPAAPPLAAASAARPQIGDEVTVKVIERMNDLGGKPQFRVQEAGNRPGLLIDGKPPATLPEVGKDTTAYRSNVDRNSPRYRWDVPTPPSQAKKPPFRR